LEVDYALRTFGIDLSTQLKTSTTMNKDGKDDESIEEDVRHRQQTEDEWRRSEAPYCDSSSTIALFPNSQDIIMGRNKAVASTWPGNIMYRKVVQDNLHRYIEARRLALGWIDKSLISLEILQIMKKECGSRFLSRNERNWVAIDDLGAQAKINKTLCSLVSEMASHPA